MSESLATRLFDANVSIEGIWILPNPTPPSEFIDKIMSEDELPESLKPFVEGWDEDEIGDLMDGRHAAWEAVFDHMHEQGKSLIVAAVATPVMTRVGSGTTVAFSWGHTHIDLIFADTLDGVIDKAIEWAAERRAAAKPMTGFTLVDDD